MNALSILLLGDAERAEFRGARPSLERWGTVHALSGCPKCLPSPFGRGAGGEGPAGSRGTEENPGDRTALTLTLSQRERGPLGHPPSNAEEEAELAPDLIVVAQAYPGEFSHAGIERLRRLAPLAPIVGLMGSWCEGETRSGAPWPAAARTYWHQWPARCDRQLRHLAQGECCTWTLPPTATEEERLLADMQCTSPPPCGPVLICSQSRAMAEWLLAACRSRGCDAVWRRTTDEVRVEEGAAAAIFDAADLNPPFFGDLGRLAAALRPAPVVALLGFPRAEDVRHALASGATAVLSKPLAVEDLFWTLAASCRRL